MALIGALGAGLMAAMHIDTALGMYVLWSIVSGPAAMMRPAAGLTLIGATGAALLAAVPLAGALVEAPWLLLALFAAASGLSTYLFSDAQLTDGWRMVQILFLTTFWVAVFDPAGFGWSTAYAFAGASVAFVLVMLFDNVLWPDPAERRLHDSIAANLDAIRVRLAAVGRGYLQPTAATALPRPLLTGAMNAHLATLSRAEREGLSPRRHALLLEAVSVTERLRLEVERLLAIAREAVPRQSRQLIAPELEAVLGAIDSALTREANELRAGFDEREGARPDTAGPIYAALEAYNRRVSELLPQFNAQARADEISNLSAFTVGLERMARLFIHTPIPLSEAAGAPAVEARIARPAAQAARKRYCLKLAAAIALAFVVGLATHRSDLTTILWTVMIAGLPTYGASMRKMILRFVGAVLGGVVALAAVIAASPNFETVLTYMLICFVALLPCAYLGQSSGSLSYPGKQAGVTFVLVFVGLSPSIREYEPLWRLWGVFLAIIVITIVFIVLWPEYAGDSLAPRLERMLEIILALMPRTARGLSERQVEAMEMDSAQILSELLEVADDARIEGRRSSFDPDAVVDAVGTLRRIAHRLAGIASERSAQPAPQLAPQIQAARDRVEDALRTQFELFLEYVRRRAATRQSPRAGWNAAAASRLLDELHAAIAADSFAAIASWSIQQRRALLAEIEAFRRLVVLTGELSEQLSRIALAATARRRRLAERPAPA